MSSKHALFINGSPRARGNTAWLGGFVLDALREQGVEVKAVLASSLHSLNNGCIGCEGCQRSREYLCVFKDDIQPLVASMPKYDYVIFATPVYFFGPTAQIKLVTDRMFSLLKSDQNGTFRNPFERQTKFGLLACAGGEESEGCDLTLEIFRRIAQSFERPFESLLMPQAPLHPDEGLDKSEWQTKVKEFCNKMTG